MTASIRTHLTIRTELTLSSPIGIVPPFKRAILFQRTGVRSVTFLSQAHNKTGGEVRYVCMYEGIYALYVDSI